jgi:hypothetical protein
MKQLATVGEDRDPWWYELGCPVRCPRTIQIIQGHDACNMGGRFAGSPRLLFMLVYIADAAMISTSLLTPTPHTEKVDKRG